MIRTPLRLAIQHYRQYQWLREEVLADLDVEGAEVAADGLTRLLALVLLEELVAVEVVLRGLHIDPVAHLHELDDLGHEVLRDARLDRYVPRVQIHVAALDALHGKSA